MLGNIHFLNTHAKQIGKNFPMAMYCFVIVFSIQELNASFSLGLSGNFTSKLYIMISIYSEKAKYLCGFLGHNRKSLTVLSFTLKSFLITGK